MSNVLAPCGHPGIPVIGAYVRCALGCEKDPLIAPVSQAVPGEPGHVPMCACKPCQLRRRTKVIVLRSRDGHDVRRLPWDGVAKEVSFTAAEDASIRHCLWLDKDGDVLIAVPVAHEVRAGDRIEMKLNPGAASDAARIEVWGESPIKRLFDELTRRIAAAYALPEFVLLGYAGNHEERHDFLYDRIMRSHQIRVCLRATARMVPNVLDVEVSTPKQGEVVVTVTEWEGDRCMHDEDFMLLRQVLTPQVPIGMKLDIVDRTPQRVLCDIMKHVKHGITAAGYTMRSFNEMRWFILMKLCKMLGEDVAKTAIVDGDPTLGRLHVRLTYRDKQYGYSVALPSIPHGTCIGS